MRIYNSAIKRVLDCVPGKKRFGLYRFLPLFFCLGAALEYSMINWTVGETNFCNDKYIYDCKYKLINLFQIEHLRNVRLKTTSKTNFTIVLIQVPKIKRFFIIMPAGVSWGEYLKFMSCALLSMMAGSQLVHMYYKPLEDLDLYIEQEMKKTDTSQNVEINNKKT